MKSEVTEHQEVEEQSPPPLPVPSPHQLPPVVSQNDPPPSTEVVENHHVSEIEHPDDELNFESVEPNLSSSVTMNSPPDQQPIGNDVATENTTSIPTTPTMSDLPPSNRTTEFTIPILEGSERSTASYRGFMYRNRHGVTGSSGTPDEDMHLARLVHRDLPFSQSRNRVNVRHNQGFKIFRLIRHDWFHVILRYPKGLCLLCLLSIWTIFVIIFAFIYVAVDNRLPNVDCGLGKVGAPIGFGQSFAFSLETTTTVGYGLPNGSNAFFENCPELQVVIYIQMVISMMFNAFLFAFFYSQVASADNRGAQILFSNKAIVSIVDGQVRFQVRVFDIDASNPVVRAHVRIYVVTKSRPVPRPLRLLQPNDELGSIIFLSMPMVISHHIDIYSLLHPPRMAPINPSGLQLRQIDSHTSNREEYTCPICGEGYITAQHLKDHIEFYVGLERDEDYPISGTHLSIPESEYKESISVNKFNATMDMEELREYFLHEISEVVCVVEGVEPISSGTFAGMHSYDFDDVVFKSDAGFSPCVRVMEMNPDPKKRQGGYISVDLDRFHEIDNLS